MSLLRNFVLAPAPGPAAYASATPAPERRPVQERVPASPAEPSVLAADSFQTLMATLHNGVDFGPFVSISDAPAARRADLRWLRVAFLLSLFKTEIGQITDAFDWLDTPNSALEGLTPFAATAHDEAFARAYALLFLAGGRPLVAASPEGVLFRDFCSSFAPLQAALTGPGSLLLDVFLALWSCAGSMVTARLHLTCAPLPGHEAMTLYHLLPDSDAAALDQVLRTVFGYTGKHLAALHTT